jgi:hypothetical protein
MNLNFGNRKLPVQEKKNSFTSGNKVSSTMSPTMTTTGRPLHLPTNIQSTFAPASQPQKFRFPDPSLRQYNKNLL